MKRPLLILLALGLMGFVTFRALFGGQTVSWHQRLTVTVETPAGEVSGSAVTAVTNTQREGLLELPNSRGVKTAVTGEAVVVEVAPGRYLFVLLDGAEYWAYAAFRLGRQTDPDALSYEAMMAQLKHRPFDVPAPLPLRPAAAYMSNPFPTLVTFDDITDPKTVRRVDPEDLAASFGPGVSLKAVTLEVTKAPVTEGKVEGLVDFFNWPQERWSKYACEAYRCSEYPIRIYFPDGTYKPLTKNDIIGGENK